MIPFSMTKLSDLYTLSQRKLLENHTLQSWLHTYDACAITTWRLGLRAPLVARKKMVSRKPELEAWGLYGIQCLP